MGILILGIIKDILDIVDIKVQRKYQEQYLNLLKAYQDEDNKPVWDGQSTNDPTSFRNNASLDDTLYQLLILGSTALAESRKQNIRSV